QLGVSRCPESGRFVASLRRGEPAKRRRLRVGTAASSIPPAEIRIFPIWGNINLVNDLRLGPDHAHRAVQPKLLLVERSRDATQSYDASIDLDLQPRDGPRICGKLPLDPVSQLLIGRLARRRANRQDGRHEK